jgi:hypothetical protein
MPNASEIGRYHNPSVAPAGTQDPVVRLTPCFSRDVAMYFDDTVTFPVGIKG